MSACRILNRSLALTLLAAALAALTCAAATPVSRADAFALEPVAPLASMGTAFTYQGQLIAGGAPVNDVCDFRFRLLDAQTGGAQVGTTQDKEGVTVTGGLFTIPDLDFGSGIFTGEARWLEVAVTCVEGIVHTTVGEPQQLTPTPYALHAGHASLATLANTAPWGGLLNVPAGFADGVDNNTTYTADSTYLTLDLTGTEFSIHSTYRLPQSCADDEIARWDDPDEEWQCSQDAGDITGIVAGAGLTGGGTSGTVTVDAQFGGSGSSTYIARSDHDHWGAAWIGSGTGLSLSGGATGIHVDGSGADLDLGGDAGTIVADDAAGADIELHSHDKVEVHLDDDNNSGSAFTVYSGADASIFSVSEAGAVAWAAQTSYLSVPPNAFQPASSTYSFSIENGWLQPLDSSSTSYYAPVMLPHGATVTRVTFFWLDTDESLNAGCWLERQLPGAYPSDMASMHSSGSDGSGSSYADSITNAVIDNSQYIYWLKWNLPSGNFYGEAVIIEYTTTGPH